MGVQDKAPRDIRLQSARKRASEDSLLDLGEYSVQESGPWRGVTIPQLVIDNCDIDADDDFDIHYDLQNEMLVIDLNGGTADDA